MKFLAWVLSLFFAFNLGAQGTRPDTETDEELRNRVQEHLDVIVDESAAIVDEVTKEVREDPQVQEAVKFAEDVKEVAEETLEDLEGVAERTKERLEEKFGTKETPAEETPAEDGTPAAEPEEPAAEKNPAEPQES